MIDALEVTAAGVQEGERAETKVPRGAHYTREVVRISALGDANEEIADLSLSLQPRGKSRTAFRRWHGNRADVLA